MIHEDKKLFLDMDLDDASRAAIAAMIRDTHFREVVLACWRIYDAKGNDYTRGLGHRDRLDNFRRVATDLGISISKAWYVYAYKHWSAISKFCKSERVESEPIESRLYDLINYAILLLIHVKEEAAGKTVGAVHEDGPAFQYCELDVG